MHLKEMGWNGPLAQLVLSFRFIEVTATTRSSRSSSLLGAIEGIG